MLNAIAIGAVLLGGLVMYNKMKSKQLQAEGKIIERSDDYLEQNHIFSTKTSSIESIFEQLNQDVLREHKINIQTYFSEGYIVFRNHDFAGSFVVVFESQGCKDDGLYQYSFYFNSIHETKDGFYSRTDVFGSNVLLTAIERAVLELDGQAQVKREYAQRKVRTSIF